MNETAVIIRGDIIGSKKIPNKGDFWNKLDNVIKDVNEEFKQYLEYDIEIFKGDEITAMVKNPRKKGDEDPVKIAYKIASKMFEYLSPIKIRLVISEGEIDSQRKTDKLNEKDGEVFWNASQTLQDLKKSKRFIRFSLKNREKNPMASSMADLITELKYQWTETEKEIIRLYETHNNQEKVADELKTTQQSVSDGLRRSKHKIIREAEKVLVDFL